MPINKFELSLGGGSESHYQWRGLLINYVRNNALCIVAADAKSRKIRRVALLVDDADVANKRYMQQSSKFERSSEQNREENCSFTK